MALENTFFQLRELGLFDIFLPFILIFVVVFAVLQKVRIFDDKRVNTMIALVMGMATIGPHVLWGTGDPTNPRLVNGMPDVVNIINNSLPSVSMLLIVILMALIIIGILGRKVELGNTSLSGWIAMLAFAAVGFIFAVSAGLFDHPWTRTYILADPELMTLIVVILVFSIIVWFVTKDEGDETRMSKESIGDRLAGAFLNDKK